MNSSSKKTKNKYASQKYTLLTLLFGAAGVQGIKNMIFGKPPKTWRKTLVYGATAGYFLLNLYGDKVNTVYQDAKEFLNNKQAQQISVLATERQDLTQSYQLEQAKTDSLENVLQSLQEENANEIQTLRDNLQNYEQRLVQQQNQLTQNNTRYEELTNNASQHASADNTQQTPNQQRANTNQPSVINWYAANPRDTFEKIAQTYLGDENKANILRDINPGVSKINIGQPILLPENIYTTVDVNNTTLPRRTIQTRLTKTRYEVARTVCSGRNRRENSRKLNKYNNERGNFAVRRARGHSTQIHYVPEDC